MRPAGAALSRASAGNGTALFSLQTPPVKYLPLFLEKCFLEGEILACRIESSHSEPTAQPTSLLASPDSSGVNSLAWNRNGNKPATTFVIEAMLGASTTFEQIGTTTKTRFDHTGQTPGVKATYRVTAERADISSLPSQSVTVYGSPVTLTLQKAA